MLIETNLNLNLFNGSDNILNQMYNHIKQFSKIYIEF